MNLGIGTQRYMSSDLEISKKYEKKKAYKNEKSKRKETKIKKNTDNTINTALYLSFFTSLSSINYILNEKKHNQSDKLLYRNTCNWHSSSVIKWI